MPCLILLSLHYKMINNILKKIYLYFLIKVSKSNISLLYSNGFQLFHHVSQHLYNFLLFRNNDDHHQLDHSKNLYQHLLMTDILLNIDTDKNTSVIIGKILVYIINYSICFFNLNTLLGINLFNDFLIKTVNHVQLFSICR